MTPIKTERIIHYQGGMERRSSVQCDENGDPIKPDDFSKEGSKEWDSI